MTFTDHLTGYMVMAAYSIDSAVTAIEKSSINTTRKSTTRFLMSLRRIVYADPKPPKGAVKRSIQNLNSNLR